MSETFSDREDRLQRRLRDLSDHVAFPERSDLAARVSAELKGSPAPHRRVLEPLYRPGFAFGVALVLALAVGILTFSPSAREAVADFLGIRGISITGEEPPEVPRGEELDVAGEQVTLDEARRRAGFGIAVPRRLGGPDEVYFATNLPDGVVTLLYGPGDDLPERRSTGVGALITQFRADVDVELIEKVQRQGTELEPVTVNGGEGYWLSGRAHAIGYIGPDGEFLQETLRLAGNTLIWQQGDLSLRLEADLPLEEALAIASSMD
jgi:hypothetical protein